MINQPQRADNLQEYGPLIQGHPVIAWFHDESIFYAHDQRKKGWYHKDTPAKPYAKGEAMSLMIADFVSANFRWLLSKDGKRSAWRVMKPRKNKDSDFTNCQKNNHRMAPTESPMMATLPIVQSLPGVSATLTTSCYDL